MLTALPNLELKQDTKYLRMWIDSTPSWKPHIDQLCIGSGTYVVYRINKVCGINAAKTAYFALFESRLRYGIATWEEQPVPRWIDFYSKKVIRCLADQHPRGSWHESFKKLQILTVVFFYIRETILHSIHDSQVIKTHALIILASLKRNPYIYKGVLYVL